MGGCTSAASPAAKDPKSGGAKQGNKKVANSGKLLDKYVLGEVLGQGAFGVVYKCTSKEDPKKLYAVKMIDQVETSPADIKKEIDMIRKLEHPYIIKMYDVYHEKVFVCMVLELYKGGDMIQGMMQYWKTKGMIPILATRFLSKMMWQAVAYIHSKDCVHRDVKGDNFMMDIKDVAHPQNRLYLSDFGTVCELLPGQRLNSKCGTRHYWPPEMYALNYAHKVDNWAVGVVMYGLVSGKFPFKGEDDVKNKVLTIPKRCPSDGCGLIHCVLERSETKRFEASQAVAHKFLASVETITPDVPDTPEEIFNPEVKEAGANAGVQQRRAELVDRLQKAQDGKAPQGESGHLTLRTKDSSGFVVLDKHANRTTKYAWWTAPKAESLMSAWGSAPKMQGTDLSASELSSEEVKKMLLTGGNINIDGFGKGQAKGFSELVTELQSGQSRLQLDASKHKHIVRVVDVILLRLVYGTGSSKKYLIEVSEKFPDGRVRNDINQLPGDKKAPHENAVRTADRLVQRMKMKDLDIKFDYSTLETFEQIEDSPSYPGLTTVYRKEILTGQLNTKDPKELQRIGAAVSGGKFMAEDGKGYQKTYAWLSEAECTQKNVKINVGEDKAFSALVYPPVGLEEEELEAFMQSNKIDTSAWGKGTARSLANFSEELVKGEATLQEMADGKVKRVVDVVILKVARQTKNDVIVEAEETFKDSSKKLDRLPAVKRRSDEHQFLAARRLITYFLKLNENCVSINENDVRLVEEETESTSYPGLSTIYRKRYMTANMTEEAFFTC